MQEPAPEQAVAAEPQPDSPAEPSFDVYAVEESDVAQMAGDLQRAHIDCCRESGEPFMDCLLYTSGGVPVSTGMLNPE